MTKAGLPVPTEHAEQAQFVAMVEAERPRLAPLLYAIPNGANKSMAARMKFKTEGLRSGVPDMFFAYPAGEYHGLYLEMKRRRGGILSDEQKMYIERLRERGYRVEVCKGCDEAMSVFRDYLDSGRGTEDDI